MIVASNSKMLIKYLTVKKKKNIQKLINEIYICENSNDKRKRKSENTKQKSNNVRLFLAIYIMKDFLSNLMPILENLWKVLYNSEDFREQLRINSPTSF